MKEKIKNRLIFFLKYAIGLALLGWAAWRFDFTQIVDTIGSISITALLASLFLSVLSLTLQFRRWRYLIGRHSADYEEKDLLPAFFAGCALRLLIPGGHAEITKIFLLPGRKRGKAAAFVLEKYFETYLKFMLILIALPLILIEYRTILWGIAAIGVILYFFLPRLLRISLIKKYQEKDINYRQIFFHTLLFSLAVFITLVLQYFVLLNDSETISFSESLLGVIFVWGAGLLPISISGLGVRENLAAHFFGLFSISAETAVAMAFFVFLTNILTPALIGAFFIYRKRKTLKRAGREIRYTTKKIYRRYKSKSKTPPFLKGD